MDSHAPKIAKGSFSVLVAAISILLLSFFFNPILKRLIGLSSFGTYAIILSIYSIALPLVALGLFNSVRKHMGEVRRTEKKNVAGAGYMLSFYISISTLVGGYALVIGLWLLHLLEGEVFVSFLIIVPALSLIAFYETSRSILFGLHKEGRAEILRVIERLIAFSFGLILVYLGFGVSGVFWGVLLSIFAVCIMAFAFVNVPMKLGLEPLTLGYKRYSKQIASFGGLTLVSMLLAQALYQSDILLIGIILNDTRDVGAYKTALVLAEMLWLIPIAFQSVLLHYVSEMWKKSLLKEMERIITAIAKYVALALILIGFGLLVCAGPFMKLYWGEGVEDAVLPLQILIIGSVGFGLARVINPVIEGSGHIKASIRISAGIVALNIILNTILIPIYGIIGAAVATSIAYFTKMIQYLYLLKRLRINVLSHFPTVRMLVLAVSFPAILFLFSLLPVSESMLIGIVATLGFTLFLAMTWLLKLWNLKELRTIVSYIIKP